MRYHELLQERAEPDFDRLTDMFGLDESAQTLEMLHLARDIRDQCKPFLRQVHSPFVMYRGIKSPKFWLHSNIQLTNREPVDSDQQIHDAANIAFTKMFREPFRNSMFVNGSREMVEEYGNIYFAIPIGEFSFCWSPKIEDLYTFYSEAEMDGTDLGSDAEQIVATMLDYGKYQTTDLTSALMSGHEIMIRAKEYYAIAEQQPAQKKEANQGYGPTRSIKLSNLGEAFEEIVST